MAGRIIILLSLFTLTIRANAQFYDLFQSFQPFLQNSQTTKPDYDFFADFGYKPEAARRRNDAQTKRPSAITDDRAGKDYVRTTSKPKKTTQASLYSYTTAKPVRKNVKNNSSHRNVDSSNKNKNQALTSNNRRQFYEDTSNNVDYYTERTTRRNQATTRRNVATRPVTQRPDYYSFTQRPGVKPAPVDTNRPPITNRPPTSRPYAVYPIVTDSSVIRFPEDPDTSPELLQGVDEDSMSSAEKRRYIALAEKMCDKYKSLSIQRVQAIPLLPSPKPVQVNVSVCTPTTVPLVVGGKVVGIEEFPHMAMLGWTYIQKSGYSWKCGGSLISEQFVLTAGHCASQEKDDNTVTGAPRVVQLGSSYMDDTGALVVKVLSVVRHPRYTRPKSYYDIALVKMLKPVTFSQVIKPACLGEPPGVGEPVIVTGWGRTEFGGALSLELRSVSVPIWDMDECREVLGVSRKMPEGPSRDSQICAGEKRGGKDACQGDSGGPAQIQDGCVWRVIGVTSIGRSCGAPNTPAIYARVAKAFIAAQVWGKNTASDQNTQPNVNKPNNSRPNSNNNNNQNSRPSNQDSWNTNSQPNRNNGQNVNKPLLSTNQQNAPHNNNQNSWGSRPNNNYGNERNGNNWNQQNNDGRWNGNGQGEYQSSNVNRNNFQYTGVENPGYDSGNYKPETDYGNNRRGYNYNDNRNDYDDYYDSNRERRNNNFRANIVTTRRPSFGWSGYGF